MYERTADKIKKVFESITANNTEMIHIWQNHIVFTWRWWLVTGLLVVPWGIWMLLRKKDSTNRLLYSGFFVFLMTLFLDSVGLSYGLWNYLVTPLPYIHTFFLPWDLTMFPVITMLFLQYQPHVSPYIKALVYSLAISFIAEPIFVWMRIYTPIHWMHYDSVPFYFVIYLIAHFVSRRKGFEPIE